MEPVSPSHIPGFSPHAHQMLEIWASMSPPDPIEELKDQQERRTKKARIDIAILRFVETFFSESIKTSGYFTSASTGAQDENRTHDLRITSAFKVNEPKPA